MLVIGPSAIVCEIKFNLMWESSPPGGVRHPIRNVAVSAGVLAWELRNISGIAHKQYKVLLLVNNVQQSDNQRAAQCMRELLNREYIAIRGSHHSRPAELLLEAGHAASDFPAETQCHMYDCQGCTIHRAGASTSVQLRMLRACTTSQYKQRALADNDHKREIASSHPQQLFMHREQ